MKNVDKDGIIANAVHIEFPKRLADGKMGYVYEEGENTHRLPDIDMTFHDYPLNGHHFNSQYHFRYVLPLLEDLFGLGFDMSDFKIKANIINNGSHDVSFLTPVNDEKTFTVESVTFNKNEPLSGKYEILMGKRFPNRIIRGESEYHFLYCLPHTVSIITNHGKNNGKTILILGDSQIIPDIPVIAFYYENVIYVDNRNRVRWMHRMKEYDIDDILLETYAKEKLYYYGFIR